MGTFLGALWTTIARSCVRCRLHSVHVRSGYSGELADDHDLQIFLRHLRKLSFGGVCSSLILYVLLH